MSWSAVDWGGALLWGFFATLVLTLVMSAAQGLGLSRISMPFLAGSVFTPDRDRANVVGAAIHFVNGLVSALVYAVTFTALGRATWWLGALLGLLQGLFVLIALLPLLPAIHPRMASEDHGPTPTRQLEPPGFLGLHYGRRTPLITLAAHLAYGVVLGALYQVR
jgi:hypothetical protein